MAKTLQSVLDSGLHLGDRTYVIQYWPQYGFVRQTRIRKENNLIHLNDDGEWRVKTWKGWSVQSWKEIK